MFELQTFGSVELTNPEGQSVRSVLAQPRRTALLIYLAAAAPRGFHRRDTLLALLWPDSDAERGRAALSQAVYFLRRSLAETVVVNRGSEEIGVDAARLRCDVARFEEALRTGREEDALAIHGGDFLEGFHVPDAPDFERWMERERSRLRARAAAAAEKLVDGAESRGDLPGALRWARHARSLAPEGEASLRRLLVLLARSGDRAEAVREYESFAARLRADLDVEPSAETRALVRELRLAETPLVPSVQPSEPGSPAPDRPAGRAREERGAAASTAGSPESVPDGRSAPFRPGPRPRNWTRWIGTAVAAATLLAVTTSRPPGAEPAVPEPSRVVVAPFENRTGDASLDVLADMAADWVAQGLQQSELVQVVAPASAAAASRARADGVAPPGEAERLAAIAGRWGARVVVSGSVYRQGDSLQFRAQLVDPRLGTVLRSIEGVTASAGEPIPGVEQLGARVAGALASTLDRRVASLSTPQSRAPNFAAYREYVLGLELFQRQRYGEALPHFQAAAEHDTAFALPVFWAAFAHGNLGAQASRDSLIRTLAPRRERLVPLDRYALDYFLASVREDVAGASQAVRRAAKISPGSNWSFLAGRHAMLTNRPEEALRHFRQVDPEHGWARGWKPYWQNLGSTLHQLERFGEELETARRARRLDPDDLMPRFIEIRALVALGQPVEARVRANEAMLLPPSTICPGEVFRSLGVELGAHGFEGEAMDAFGAAIAWYRSPAAEAWSKVQSDPEATRRAVSRLFALSLEGARRWTELEAEYLGMLRRDSTDREATAGLGRLATRRGDRAAAERSLLALQGSRSSLVDQARIAALLGDLPRALDLLRRAAAQGQLEPEVMHTRREFDVLRGLPEFRALVSPRE